ncbi:hypothetical protein EJB05_53776, partial [Eragrostis curvula]
MAEEEVWVMLATPSAMRVTSFSVEARRQCLRSLELVSPLADLEVGMSLTTADLPERLDGGGVFRPSAVRLAVANFCAPSVASCADAPSAPEEGLAMTLAAAWRSCVKAGGGFDAASAVVGVRVLWTSLEEKGCSYVDRF